MPPIAASEQVRARDAELLDELCLEPGGFDGWWSVWEERARGGYLSNVIGWSEERRVEFDCSKPRGKIIDSRSVGIGSWDTDREVEPEQRRPAGLRGQPHPLDQFAALADRAGSMGVIRTVNEFGTRNHALRGCRAPVSVSNAIG